MDFTIQTYRKIKSNRPGEMVKDYERKTRILIDLPRPKDNNVSVKEQKNCGFVKLKPCQL